MSTNSEKRYGKYNMSSVIILNNDAGKDHHA